MRKLFSTAIVVVGLFVLSAFTDKPEALRYVNYSIFGKEYAKTPIYNNSLKGHVYYIVSGHGGPDPGAMFNQNGHWLCEDEYAYDVSLRLARNLIGNGAKVYMITRDENDGIRDETYLEPDKDETVWGGARMPLNQRVRLKQRSDAINQLYRENEAKGYKTQRAIVTHVDSRYQNHKVDVFFYYNPNSTSGRSLANTMYSTIKSEYDEHQRGRGYEGVVKARNLWMLRETIPTTVYIELGNISNSFDQKRLLLPNNRQAIANWLADGVVKEG
ncbi:N-acetylmuramoyl-L-alanine amidase family protein [Jiulongibacter sp. NS-SX5]|uniref:N-acetylmuramoyl-L-alanine amidase family protein n=1 Tax=Jiulongibacter sp. NS-SX5 TaxID=3463854 RepID=UPI0040596E6A